MTALVTSDGVRIEYDEHGPATGRPVVLLAGFTASRATWLYQVGALADAGYRVIAVDIRGHGTADHPAGGVTLARRAADVAELLESLDLRGVVIVAQSMGGNTVWPLLRDFGTERIAGIVIVDQTPRMLNDVEWPFGYYGYDESNAATYFAAGPPPTGRGTPLWRRGMRLVRLLRAVQASPKRSRTLDEGELQLLQEHAGADWRPVIAAADVPMLFIAGAQSEMWPSGHAAASAALNPQASAAVIERDGHAANIEQPRQFNELLLRFLTQVE